MYLNHFRANHANGLEPSKKCDIEEKKAALKRSPGVDTEAVARIYKNSSFAKGKKIRAKSESTVDVP